MKRLLGIIALVLLTGSLAIAQSVDTKAAHPTKDETTLIALERQWCEAYKQRDTKTLARLLADDFIYTSEEGQVQNKAQYLDSILKDNVIAYTLEDVRARAYGTTGIVTAHSNWKYTSDGKEASGDFRSTDVFVKQHGQWRAVASHETRVPGR
jgi:ketosteroid isomerase-like protein